MTPAPFPAFDPESPDADILSAYHNRRANSAWGYAQDDQAQTDELTAKLEAADALALAEENFVLGNFATTPTGVFCKLSLALSIGSDRWLDIALSRHGFRDILARRDDLDGRDQIIVNAMDELLHLEWETAVADFEKAKAISASTEEIKALVEGGWFRMRSAGGSQPEWMASALELLEAAAVTQSDTSALNRLYATLTPDQDALRLKIEIARREDYEIPFDWVARDLAFLAGDMRTQQGDN